MRKESAADVSDAGLFFVYPTGIFAWPHWDKIHSSLAVRPWHIWKRGAAFAVDAAYVTLPMNNSMEIRALQRT